MPNVNNRLLGDLSVRAFLGRHWQKQPLLVRNAMPNFGGLVDRSAMIELACGDACESRLVVRQGRRWILEHGPFEHKRFDRLPATNWTLLLQGLDKVLPRARQLLALFDFIPYSRLDDLMVSYAADGGGVGPHFDSYDVFLLQGPGQRHWRVGKPADLALVENAPLKILKRFSPDGQCLLCAGDMLYLPPGFAHDGVALGAAYTYSIGFRAPSHRELMSQFLLFLEENLAVEGRYADPGLTVQSRPAQIGVAMIAEIERLLGTIHWTRRHVVEFLGRYLTEPKPHVRFSPPRAPLSDRAFRQSATRNGVALALSSSMLYARSMIFINGELHKVGPAAQQPLRRLANARQLPGRQIPRTLLVTDLLYRWYRDGYICLSPRLGGLI
jgi:50S ribosomal protein L16 3-hydroxylase